MTRLAHVPIEVTGITTYAQVEKLLYREDGRWIQGRKVARNTFLERRGMQQGIALKLHTTDVLLWRTDNTVTLNSGGWLTNTTKTRMNDWLPKDSGSGRLCQIWTDRGYWQVGFEATKDRVNDLLPQHESVPFHDLMVVDLATLTEFTPTYNDSSDRQWNAEIDKKIASYVTAFRKFDATPLRSNSDPDVKRQLLSYLDMKEYPTHIVNILRVTGIRRSSHSAWRAGEDIPEGLLRLYRDDLRKLFRGVLYQGYHSRRIQKGV